ncbi:NAD(P)-dependent oxidoreductase [Brevibacterium aurantiacum]|uniref:NAD(P)-dependent oxidoreductase n=1 Tax=Brevibacterium aurantiacum TaxID=273384 RepID=UPI001865C261|nr:NAD(P)H-binding protein [Brevibacterium aurantiacum]
MRILVPGATGMVGGHVVEQALGRGHEVVAIARNPATLAIEHPRLTKTQGDILDAASVEPLLAGVDAVVSTVGIGTSKQPTALYSEGTRNLLAGMDKHGVERIVVISSEVAEHWAHQGLFKLWVVLPLLQKFIGATYDDMRRMDIALWESDAQWSAIRAPRIRPAAAKGRYRLDTDKPIPRGWMITAPDMATALLDIAERDDLGRKHVYVAN